MRHLCNIASCCQPPPPNRALWLVPVFVLALSACVSTAVDPLAVARIAPLQVGDHMVVVEEVSARIVSPDLLSLDQDMRDFVQRHTAGQRLGRSRLTALHSAVRGAGSLHMTYDPFAEGSAEQTFHRGTGNCLAYASLFVALAREAGFKASYQLQQVRPQWTMMGERVAVGLHVNAMITLGNGEQYQADIDPLQSRDAIGSRLINEDEALALYHSNIAMRELSADDYEKAWLHTVRALQLAPDMAHIWVNLGAIYRHADQLEEAERLYLYALKLSPWNRSAMNNLVVLYEMQSREDEYAYWSSRIDHYRDSNPYYHAWQGDRAAEQEQWREALEHYEQAYGLASEDSSILYALGLIHFRLNEHAIADDYISRAIEAAYLRSDRQRYQLQLQAVREAAVAKH